MFIILALDSFLYLKLLNLFLCGFILHSWGDTRELNPSLMERSPPCGLYTISPSSNGLLPLYIALALASMALAQWTVSRAGIEPATIIPDGTRFAFWLTLLRIDS